MPVMEGWRKKAIVGVKETMSGWEMVEDQEEKDDSKVAEVLIDCGRETMRRYGA